MEQNSNLPYNKEETMKLYNQRKVEAEKIEGEINYLKGNIGAQLNNVKKVISDLHPQVISFYNIQVPPNFNELSSEQLLNFVDELARVEQTLGAPVQHYLQTGDISVLSQLPKLEDLTTLQQGTVDESQSLPETKQDDALDILRNS